MVFGSVENLWVFVFRPNADPCTQQGMAAVHQVKDNAIADPKSYIDTILNVHRKYNKIVQEAFDNDSGFATALDRAATKFVNE